LSGVRRVIDDGVDEDAERLDGWIACLGDRGGGGARGDGLNCTPFSFPFPFSC